MKLQDIARTVRSKNAGSFMITVEIIFNDPQKYYYIKDNAYISQEAIAKAYDLPIELVTDFCFYDPGLGIKANFRRLIPSGGPNESDVYGCQQYAPLLNIEFPDLKE